MLNIDITNNLLETEEYIKSLHRFIPNLEKKILKAIVSKGKSKVKQGLSSSGIQTRTGRLKNAVFGTNKKSEVGYFGIRSKQIYKALTLLDGKTIVAKKLKYLKFKVNGNWVTVESVTISKHPYMDKANSYAGNSTELLNDINKVVNRELSKQNLKGVI
jgi:hypothetical protein